MAKAEFGTPKHLANQMKARGLQKLKWYCQVCNKQCRDANGFQSHIRSETHLRKISNVTSQDIENYSTQFQSQFLRELRDYHGEKKINANKFYNSLIQDKDHVHLNSTKWTSMSQFIQHLAKSNLIRIETDSTKEEDGLSSLDISYVNNSSDNILREEMLKKSEDEQRKEEGLEMQLIKQQIKRGNIVDVVEEVKVTAREESEKPVKISLGLKKKPIETSASIKTGFKIGKPAIKKNIFK